jgi:Bacterial Ig-like domain (group 3)
MVIVSFQDGSSNLGQATLDTTGTASLSLNTLALGSHSIVAYFLATPQYTATQSATSTLTVYSSDPDLSLIPSATSLSLTRNGSSLPLGLQVASKWGMTGAVTFTCSGMPTGMACAFSPAQLTLTAGSLATTQLTVSNITQTSSVAGSQRIFVGLLLPLQLLWLRRRRIAIRSLFAIILIGTFASLGLTGCAGSPATPTQQPSTLTILVTATCGNVSRSAPITVTLQ